MYRGAALHGADGEAEGDEVDEQDGGQHRGGAGHGVWSAARGQRRRRGKRLLVGPGISDVRSASCRESRPLWLVSSGLVVVTGESDLLFFFLSADQRLY